MWHSSGVGNFVPANLIGLIMTTNARCKVKDLNPIIAVIDILIDVIVLNHVATCATTSAATITSTINYHHHHLKQYVLIIADGGQLEVSFGFILFPVERLWRERKLSSGSEISNSWYTIVSF